jgi:TolA-binding protein
MPDLDAVDLYAWGLGDLAIDAAREGRAETWSAVGAPGKPEPGPWLGRALLTGGGIAESRGWMARWLLECPDGAGRAEAKLVEQRAAYFLNDYEAVERATSRVLADALSPGLKDEALFWNGRADFVRLQYESALHYFSEIRFAPWDPGWKVATGAGTGGEITPQQVALWTGACLFALGRFSEALDRFLEALEADASDERMDRVSNESVGFYVAATLLGLSRPAEAAVALDEFVSAFPQSRLFPDANYLLGLCQYRLGDYREAARTLTRAIVRHPFFSLGVSAEQSGGTLPVEGLPPEALDVTSLQDPALWWGDDCLYLLSQASYRDSRRSEAAKYLSWLFTYFPFSPFATDARYRYGLVLLETTDTLRADQALSEFLLFASHERGSSPQAGEVLFRLGWERFTRRQWEEARGFFLRLVREHPAHPRVEDALVLAAEAAYERKDYPLAGGEFRRVREIFPHGRLRVYATFGEGWCYSRQKQHLRAAASFEAVLNDTSASSLASTAGFMVGRSYYMAEDNRRAAQSLRSFLRDHPRDRRAGEAQFMLATAVYRAGDFERAEQEFRRALIQYPRSASRVQAQMGLAHTQFAREKYVEAEENYSRVLALGAQPETMDEARYQMERCYYHLGRYASPLEINLNFVAKYPASRRSARLLLELGSYYLQSGDVELALGSFRRVLSDFSFAGVSDQAQEGIARAYRQAGEIALAIEAYRILRDQYPQSPLAPRAQLRIGEIYQERRDLSRALQEYQKVAADFPRSPSAPQALMEMAKIFGALDRRDEEVVLLDQILRNYPGSDDSEEALVLKSRAYVAGGEIARARETAERGLRRTRGGVWEGELLTILGELDLQEGRYAAALASLSKALQARGNASGVTARAALGAGVATQELGDLRRAAGFFEKARETGIIPWSRQAEERLRQISRRRGD